MVVNTRQYISIIKFCCDRHENRVICADSQMKANDRAGKGNFVIKLQHTLYITEHDLVLKKDGQTLRAVHSDGHSDHITLHMVD